MSRFIINDVRSEALFASSLQRSEGPTAAQVRQAITETIRRYGSRGCAARMAQEFGDAPESAAARMRWARQLVADLFADEFEQLSAAMASDSTIPVPALVAAG